MKNLKSFLLLCAICTSAQAAYRLPLYTDLLPQPIGILKVNAAGGLNTASNTKQYLMASASSYGGVSFGGARSDQEPRAAMPGASFVAAQDCTSAPCNIGNDLDLSGYGFSATASCAGGGGMVTVTVSNANPSCSTLAALTGQNVRCVFHTKETFGGMPVGGGALSDGANLSYGGPSDITVLWGYLYYDPSMASSITPINIVGSVNLTGC